MFVRFIFNAIGLILLGTTVSLGHGDKEVFPQPDPAIQLHLKGLISPKPNRMFDGDEELLRSKLAKLRELSNNDDAELVRQLFVFSMDANGMKEAMLPGVIIEQLKIQKTAITSAVLPLLDSKNKSLRAEACNWLGGTEEGDKKGRLVSFARYEPILQKKTEDQASGLIRYMYNRNPEAAVVTVAQVYGRDIPVAEIATHAKSGVKEAVDYFASRPEWWAQLYVAVTLKKHSELPRDPELLNKLKQDEHPLVREAFTEITKKHKQSK